MRSASSGIGAGVGTGKAMLLTPAGGAAIAVVRLVGEGVGDFLRAHFDRPVREGRCVHGNLVDGGRVLDDPVVVVSGGGRVADVSLHGGPWVVRSVLELARRAGFEIVEAVGLPLEAGAVDAGGELGREVLRSLPMAQTELAVRTLLGQEAAWERFKGASPSGEEVGAVIGDRSLWWLLRPPRVAIVGVPNVGKSTLANQLFGRERSITADVPGTTRDWVGETANLDGLAVVLVDTPGVRETGDAVEAEAIGRAREEVGRADLVVVVTDASRASEEERALVGAFPGAVYVANKADLAGGAVADGWLGTVGATGRGVDELRRVIRGRFLGAGAFDAGRARWWTGRQRAILERAKSDAGALVEI